MKRVDALSFIGQTQFEFDVVCNDEVLCTAESLITPDIILKLCFKEVYSGSITDTQKPATPVFSEKNAENFSALCVNIAKIMNYSKDAVEQIKISSYYLKSACVGLALEDAAIPDFFPKIIESAISMVQKKGLANDAVVEGIRNCRTIYKPDYTHDKPSTIHYSDIISVALSFERLMEKHDDKNVCLDILRKNGVQYFNVFVLHRFINYMRNNTL